MQQRLSLVTLGVRDLQAARAFYGSVLGWSEVGEPNESIAFFRAESTVLALYPDELLADDIGVAHHDPTTVAYRGFTLAINLASRAEVDELFAELAAAGVTIVKPPHVVFWGGYSGYFADPDGHHWEVAHNPFWELDDAGVPRVAG